MGIQMTLAHRSAQASSGRGAIDQLNDLADATLVIRARKGDAAAFSLLMERYFGVVMGCLALGSHRAADAEDLTQEVFLTAYRKLESLAHPDRFGPWIWRIARNVRNDYLRASQRTDAGIQRMSQTEGAHPRNGERQPEERASYNETADFVLQEISRLPESYRTVLYLRLFDEQPPHVIATLLGIKESTVRMRLKRGLEKLRRRLDVRDNPGRDSR